MDIHNKELKSIKGVGDHYAELLNQLGVVDFDTLFSYFPRNYEDWSNPETVASAPFDIPCCIKAKVITPIKENFIRKNMVIYKFIAEDDEGGTLYISVFNNRFIKNTVKMGKEYLFFGKSDGNMLEKHISSPIIRPVGYEKIRPIYKVCEGISSATVEKIIGTAIKGYQFVDYLPQAIKIKYSLCDLSTAVNMIHFPKSKQDIKTAQRRLAFDEMFFLQVALHYKKLKKKISGYKLDNDYTKDFFASLPYSLTDAQKNAIADCIKDMSSGEVMNRLIQGDVGSGKTVVAAAIIYNTIKNGYQAALMAPTEILAEQHFNTFKKLFHAFDISVELLTGSATAKTKKELKDKFINGETNLIIGTHAIIQDDVEFQKLGLVVTDEQHRFGVEQRTKLSDKGKDTHILVMSATPIPRTLSLIVYGDLDISIIDELPAGRQPISTYCVTKDYKSRLYKYLKEKLDAGRQGYIVCPLVEDNDSGLQSAVEYYKSLSDEFSEYSVALLHGKMRANEKDRIMKAFSKGDIQLLISTTVIEVGVDVPNAVIMIIENAERFGLSQLHQLRGRIGRGREKSDCILITDSEDRKNIPKRLQVICSTLDGFEIAEEDLKLRGPGDFLGKRQHGLPEMKIADISADMQLLRTASDAADEFLKIDPSISDINHREIRKKVASILKNLIKYGYN